MTKKTRRLRLSGPLTALSIPVLSGVAMLLALMLQAGSLMQTLEHFLQAPILLLLNYLPMLLTLGILYALMGNVFYGAGLTALIWGVLSYINLVKTEARGDPFVPGDVLLVFEGIEAVGSYQLQLHPTKLAVLLGTCAVLAVLGVFIKSHEPRLRLRLVTGGVCAAVFVGAMSLGYGNNGLYQSLPGPDRSNIPEVFEFPIAFCTISGCIPWMSRRDFPWPRQRNMRTFTERSSVSPRKSHTSS